MSPTPPKDLRRIARTSLVGTTIEWYDFTIYGMAAVLVFGPQFFPSFSSAAGTLAAFATFGVGFLARPLGGVVMGHYGDRVGRKSMLVASLLLMGIATFAIGLLPNYETIGVWAPILLVFLRFLQGLGVGGEWGGAVLIAVEHAPPNRRIVYGSFAQMGNPLGIASATLVFLVLSLALPTGAFAAWGWRIPFLLSAILIVLGVVARARIEESPDFARLQRKSTVSRAPIRDLFRDSPRRVILAGLASVAAPAIGYLLFVYLVAYARDSLGVPSTVMLWLIVAATAAWAALIIPASLLANRIGARPVLLGGLVLLGVWIFPFFALLNSTSIPLMALAYGVTAVGIAAFTGPQATAIADLFPTHTRYSGASVAYQVGAILGGALAPIIAAALLVATGTTTSIAVYVAGLAAVSIVAVLLLGGLLDRPAEAPENVAGPADRERVAGADKR